MSGDDGSGGNSSTSAASMATNSAGSAPKSLPSGFPMNTPLSSPPTLPLEPPSVYREYLDSELASENERTWQGIVAQVARYGALKFGMLTLSHPFDTARLLRQLQYGGIVKAGSTHGDGGSTSVGSSPPPKSTPLSSAELRREEGRLRRTPDRSRAISEMFAAAGEQVSLLPSETMMSTTTTRASTMALRRGASGYLDDPNDGNGGEHDGHDDRYDANTGGARRGERMTTISGTSSAGGGVENYNDNDGENNPTNGGHGNDREGSMALLSSALEARLPYRTSQWPLILDKKRSLWGSLGEISRRQGLFSVWRGISAAWAHEILLDLSRATVEEALDSTNIVGEIIMHHASKMLGRGGILGLNSETTGTNAGASINEMISSYDDPLRPALTTSLAQGIVATLLAPVEMARVRLMAQSMWPGERKYRGLVHCLRTVAREEGGWLSLFLGRTPVLTFLAGSLKPLLRLLPLTWWESIFMRGGEASTGRQFTWLALQGASLCLPLLFTMPLETVRRRLMVQVQVQRRNEADWTNTTTITASASAGATEEHRHRQQPQQHSPQSHNYPSFDEAFVPYITRIRLSPIPYTGSFNCVWRMIKEEGVASLYQGWGFQMFSILASWATTLLAEMGEEDLAEDYGDDLDSI